MFRKRRLAASALVAVALLTGVSAARTSDTPPRAASNLDGITQRAVSPGRQGHVVVALGDSVASGAACSCNPFPAVYEGLLSRRTGVSATVHNYAVDGLDTGGLLAQLDQPRIVEVARHADVFLVTIGANDFGDHHDQVVEGTCTTGGPRDCVSDEIRSLRAHLSTALSELRTLRRGTPTSVLVTGYWNVFEDGSVARRSFGEAGLQASIELTRRVNATIRAVAATAGAHYVDLYEPFERQGRDLDSLMAADGDHPDAGGHVLIAETLLAAGLPRVS